MKKLVLFVLLLISVAANAQKGISYQAVILDPGTIELPGSDIIGQPLVNANVWVKFAIYSGTTSQFEEVHQTQTDAYGLVNLTIGSIASASFNSMNWDANQKSLQVFVSFNNGASYTKVSDQKLTYTPYSLFAVTATKLTNTLAIAGGGTGATTSVAARANLGLGNIDNTADVDKPISTATQVALDLKADQAEVNSALALKATVVALEAHMKVTADTMMLATKAALTDLNNYAPLASPVLTGVPEAPTPIYGTNSTQIATTAFVQSSIISNTLRLGAANATPNTNGATFSTNELKLSPADGTNAGIVNALDQTFGGLKTFKDGAAKQMTATNAVLDQSNTTSANQAGGTNQWQSFTAGTTGILSSVEWKMGTPTLPYGTAAPVTIKLYEGEGIDGTLLASVNGLTPEDGSNIFIAFPFVNVIVTADSKYTLLLTTPVVNVSWLDVNIANSYSRGKGSNDPEWDYIFKTNVKAITAESYITAINSGSITASSFVKSGGTAFQYLRADGSVTSLAALKANMALENVNNTSDIAKPVSSLTQNALNFKAPLESPFFTGFMRLNNRAEFGQNVEREQPSLKLIGLSKSGTGVNSFWPTQPYAGGGLEIGDGGAVRLVIYRKSSNTFNISTTGSLNERLGINADSYDPAYTLDINGTLGVRNSITATGIVEAAGFKLTNGTSAQYIMADGSVSTSSGSSTSTQNAVDLTTDQTIGGLKTFSSNLAVSGKLGLGTATPNAQSSLDIASALPLILPKMDQSQIGAISAPVASMLQFNTSTKKMQVYKESVASTSSVFGNTTLSSGATCLRGSGELWFRPTISGTITQIELNAFGAGEVASVVINSNYAGASSASVLLGTSNSITAVDGWNTWTFATPVNVVANTTYFITSTDANGCLGVRWSSSGDDATTGNVSSNSYSNPLNAYDPASRITVVIPATNSWVNLRDDVATTNLSTEVINVLPLANGGTGSSTKNFVDLSSAQTVAGAKSFSGTMVVGASTPSGTSAALEIKSTTQGLLLPRLTTIQRDAVNTPLLGLLIYNSTAGKIQGYTEVAGTAATLANTGSSGVGLGISYDYNICLSFTPTSNWRVSNVSITVQSVYSSGNLTLSLYSGVPGSGTLLGSQTAATSTLSGGVIAFNFSSPISVPQGSCYWKLSADNTADLSLTRIGQFNDGVNESFTALRNNNTVIVNIPSYSFPFSMAYTPSIGAWTDLH